MTQPTTYGGRPQTPAPGAPTPELRVARFRGHARRLSWSALILIVAAGAFGYFFGNLPAPFEDWMLIVAAAVIVLLLVLLPFLSWWAHVYTITTQRVIERSGIFRAKRHQLSHVRGYTIQVRRGILQRMWGAGTLVLWNGVDDTMRLVNIPRVDLVHEVLVDQVEVNQILAHRDAQSFPTVSPTRSPDSAPSERMPPAPPLPSAPSTP